MHKLFFIMIMAMIITVSFIACWDGGNQASPDSAVSSVDSLEGSSMISADEISAWIKNQTKQTNSYEVPDLYYCSQKKAVFAGPVGVLVYDREKKRMQYAVDLRKTGCQQFNSDDIKTEINVSADGKQMIVYNQAGDESGVSADGRICLYQLDGGDSAQRPVLLEMAKALREDDEIFQNILKENQNVRRDASDYLSQPFMSKLENENASISNHAFIWKDEKGEQNTSFLINNKDGSYLYTKKGKEGAFVSEKIEWKVSQKIDPRLPEAKYQGKDPIRKAVYDHVKASEEGKADDTVNIIHMNIYKTEKSGNHAKVYGLFHVSGYYRCGNILRASSGSIIPAVLHLEKEGGEYRVNKMETAEDGTEYGSSIKKMCKGHPLIAYKMMNEEFPKDIVRKDLKEYVEKHGLDIDYYQEYGWNLQKL